MPELVASLLTRDLGFLRICASLWGMELKAVERNEAADELSAHMLNPHSAAEVIRTLPVSVRDALQSLIQAGGRVPWAVFTRQWGEVRPVGPGRRDREQVYLDPTSTTEVLTYRSLVQNAFFDTPSGLQEFAYISDDLQVVLRSLLQPAVQAGSGQAAEIPLGRPAAARECQHVFPASDGLLDDAVTLLAALRLDIHPLEVSIPVNVVTDFLRSAGVLQGSDPSPDRVKAFLEMPPAQALVLLADSWQKDESFNELRQLPGLLFEGAWQNQPLATRQWLLHLLHAVPVNQWWSLTSFISQIKEKYPDFQRPAGEYDSWFIKRAADGTYLRGFSSWDEVDGALLRYLLTGPLFWLGRVDLARADVDGEVTAFRRRAKPAARQETARLTVSSNGTISIPRLVPPLVRYQVSRFCEWKPLKAGEYRYLPTVFSLQRAVGQGLKVNQLLTLLAKHAGSELPPSFVAALKRWELKGPEARVQTQVLLRLSRPEVLEELRRSKAGRFLGEVIGPTTVIIKPGAQEKVMAALADLGILAEMISHE
mgnify:CR=1 FL=1